MGNTKILAGDDTAAYSEQLTQVTDGYIHDGGFIVFNKLIKAKYIVVRKDGLSV